MPHVSRIRVNNYNPEELYVSNSKVPKGYLLFRYQTKAFDECTNSLSTFTQDEREFLERYRWLWQVPDFFKPDDLICVLNNAEAEKKAQRKLQNFDLDYESVSCPDASTLHALIPYVKRLVKLYPHIKERVKDKTVIIPNKKHGL